MIENIKVGCNSTLIRQNINLETAGSNPAPTIERLTCESHTFITGWPLVFYK